MTVLGDPAEVKAALPGLRGLTGRNGVTYGRIDARAVVQALYAMAAADEPDAPAEPDATSPGEEGPAHEQTEPANVEDDESQPVGTEDPAAPDQASEASAGDDAATAGVSDERSAGDVQAAGVDANAQAADAQPAEPSKPSDPARIAALRAREAILKTIAEALK